MTAVLPELIELESIELFQNLGSCDFISIREQCGSITAGAMKVTIQNTSARDGQCRVEFSCNLGAACAFWYGEPPSPGSDYDVEIDLPSAETLEIILTASNDDSHPIRMDDNSRIILKGVFKIDQEGNPSHLDLGTDVVLLDNVTNFPRSEAPVTIIAPSIMLYPFTL